MRSTQTAESLARRRSSDAYSTPQAPKKSRTAGAGALAWRPDDQAALCRRCLGQNRLHWCLDVQFGDDYARARSGHMALNLIRLDTSIKTSIKTKRLLAATSDEFRAALLGFEAPDEDDDE